MIATLTDYLRDRLLIETLTPTTPWYARFDDQSSALNNALNAWGRNNVIGISHSNGGAVTRNYAQLQGSGSRIDRIATIGTPHRGASIAASVINGRVFNYFGGLWGSLFFAFDYYSNSDPNWRPISTGAFETIGNVAWWFADNSSFAGLGIATTMPATQDISPGSPFLTALNSSSGLSLQNAGFTDRVGISTQVDPNGAFFRLLTAEHWRELRAAQAVAAHASLALYFHYRDHPNWGLATHAQYWLDAYWYIVLLDVAWHDFTGAIQSWNNGIVTVYPSDAFIPEWSSQYPAATSQNNLYLPEFSISHGEQRDHPQARAHFETLLVDRWGVARRSSTPPPDDAGDPEFCYNDYGKPIPC